ncbi:hypothetical protein HK100_000663 [Physocladia obscura]|uniref:Protein kinase domain-containing protein n=1 Tax=Physocladia obscura TaxID=109957 RepID=A0AAD5XF31_9FUNG|nr:hypothetical protein HK100_000663 [Physocladia obscura]
MLVHALLIATSTLASGFTDIVSFGDSVSDTGNLFRLDNGTYPPAPYYNGRFCNGPLWIEQLAGFVDATLHDYAFGAACATNASAFPVALPGGSGILVNQIPDLAAQLKIYQADPVSKSLDLSTTLFTVFAGGNDIDYAASAGQVPNIASIVAAVLAHVQNLVTLGAKNVLVNNMPPLEDTPGHIAYGATAIPILTELTAAYNTYLVSGLQKLQTADPTLHLVVNDFFNITTYTSTPEGQAFFSFTNVVDACLNSTTLTVCAEPDKYYFWDSIHPTTRAQNFIAQFAYNELFGISGYLVPDSVVNPTTTSATSTAISTTEATASTTKVPYVGPTNVPETNLYSSALAVSNSYLSASMALISTRAILFTAAVATMSSVMAGSFLDIISFGDSLSDTGNLFKLDLGIYPPAPYYKGRFSNGPVWVEYLTSFVNATLHDFAFGGSCATNVSIAALNLTGIESLFSDLPDLAAQFVLFKADPIAKNLSFDSTLFTVFAGGNDIDFTVTLSKSPNITSIVNAVLANVQDLISFGAKHILVNNMPPLEDTPEHSVLGRSVATTLANITTSYNANLLSGLNKIAITYSKVNIVINDFYNLSNYAATPAGMAFFGFTNITSACLDTSTLKACASPDNYFFWDSIHPTTKAQNYVAQFAYNQLFGISGYLIPNLTSPTTSHSTTSSSPKFESRLLVAFVFSEHLQFSGNETTPGASCRFPNLFRADSFGKRNQQQQAKSTYSNKIADYELVTDIGGVGDVSYLYLAKYKPKDELVALSYTDLTLSPDYDFVEDEHLWSVTLPVATGSCRGLLRDYFQNGFEEPVVATVLREVLSALVYLHENHMIHNDLRADNILLDMKGNVRVTGLRQLVSLTQNGGYIKNVFSILSDNIEWAAPEIMAQHSSFDEKVDIYSFGITAMELAYGHTPFDDWSPIKILLSKLEYDCPGIKTMRVMPKSFLKMVRACIRKDPRERPSAKELLDHPFFQYAKSIEYLYTAVVTHVKQNLKS